jgi:tRNA threonylcarbamoyladenosine biosynthesis protein TsaB
MLPHAEDLLTLARFAWARGEAIVADQARRFICAIRWRKPRPNDGSYEGK